MRCRNDGKVACDEIGDGVAQGASPGPAGRRFAQAQCPIRVHDVDAGLGGRVGSGAAFAVDEENRGCLYVLDAAVGNELTVESPPWDLL